VGILINPKINSWLGYSKKIAELDDKLKFIDSTENWFSMSGAVLTFISVVVQFLLSNLRKEELENLFNLSIGVKQKLENLKNKNPLHKVVLITSGITGLAGTLIWGYGDLLY